jgi:hypothetical protein
MSFPGQYAVKQMPRTDAAGMDGVILAEGGFAMVLAASPADVQLRLGDGQTAGGIAVASKAYVDLQANSGVEEGTPILAAEGTDEEQRSWPATTFEQFARLDSPAFFGTPTAPVPADADNTTKIPTTSWVKARIAEMISQANTATETIFPVGTVILAEGNGNTVFRNGLPPAPVRYSSDNGSDFAVGGSGTALAGTWRSKGRVQVPGGDDHFLLMRVL